MLAAAGSFDPVSVLADLATGPGPFLKQKDELPLKLKRPFIKVGSACIDVVDGRSSRTRVHHLNGSPVLSGVFAVGKSDSPETRMIPAVVPANMCLAMSRVPRHRFSNMLQIATIHEPPVGARLLVSGRDIRHFYHKVRASRSWRALLAHPPLGLGGVMQHFMKSKRCRAHCVWPMIFSPNASIAQGNAHQPMVPVCLHEVARVRAGDMGPAPLPVFGIRMDDLWAIDRELWNVGDELAGARVVRQGAEQWATVGL